MRNEISIRYLYRMILVLRDNPRIGISELALLARINHQRCAANIEELERLGFVQLSSRSNRKQVLVTPTGIEYMTKLIGLLMPLNN